MMDFEVLWERIHSSDGAFCKHYFILYSVVYGLETQSAFEFGSGYSTKVILAALEKTGGKLMTCDFRSMGTNRKGTGNTQEEMAQYSDIWTYVQKNSVRSVAEIQSRTYDFILHDGAHKPRIVAEDLTNIIPQMRENAILMMHDTVHPDNAYPGMEECVIDAFSKYNHELVSLPFGYGLTVVRLKEDFGHGKVSPVWRKDGDK